MLQSVLKKRKKQSREKIDKHSNWKVFCEIGCNPSAIDEKEEEVEEGAHDDDHEEDNEENQAEEDKVVMNSNCYDGTDF